MFTIVPVVEGHGEVRSLRHILPRIAAELLGKEDIHVGPPVRADGRPDLELRLEDYLQLASDMEPCDGILVLADADNDCPVDSAKALEARVVATGIPKPVQIVYARRMYETWFLASIETVRGYQEISPVAALSGDPERIGNPKRWLRDQKPHGRTYKETTDQPELSKHIDTAIAHERSRSFRRLCHAVEQLIEAIESPTV